MKKILTLALACSLVVGLFGVLGAETETVTDLYVLEDGSSTGGEAIELELTNTSDEAIEITDLEIQVTIHIDGAPDVVFSRTKLDSKTGDVLFDGEDSITINAKETETIAVLAPGLPDTWRSFDTADHTMKIAAWIQIADVGWHRLENIAEHTITPKDPVNYELSLSTEPSEPGDSIFLRLTNDSGTDVTIYGPAVVQPTGEWSNQDGEQREQFPLIGGESIAISSGETVEIVEIEPGAPQSWRNFYGPKVLNHLQIWVQTDEGLWHSEEICHPIVGEEISETITGWAKFTADNEDGTATITARADHAESRTIVTAECSMIDEYILGEPARGLTKTDFQVLERLPNGGERTIGTVLSVRETEPGLYELTWSHNDGTHEVFVQILDRENEQLAYYLNFDRELYPDEFDYVDPVFETHISTPVRPLVSNLVDGRYQATLEYPSTKLTFSSDNELDADISFRRKGSSDNPNPANAKPAGIYMDINVVRGELNDCEITLEVSYDLDDIPPGMNETQLRLFRFNETKEEWELLPDQEVDTENKVIRVKLTGFSEFGIFEVEAADEEDELAETGTNVYFYILLGLLLVIGGLALLRNRKLA
ncbi:MAG: LPXTG cell wall anchor domain-containing protein [Firmicutes bacterium]|nr:LPXTG cell wall anchor domain-containing protein [Bacillota bacterium]